MHTLLVIAAADRAQARKDLGEPNAFACELTTGDERTGSVTHYAAGCDPDCTAKWLSKLTVPVTRQDGQMDGRREWCKPLLESAGVKQKRRDTSQAVEPTGK